MLKPILAFSLVLAGALSASGGDFEVKISDRYLNFPVSHRDGRCRMTLSAPGHEDYSFDIRIASDKPDYWVFLDMSGYKGKTVTVSYPEDRAGLASIYQDDEIAGTGPKPPRPSTAWATTPTPRPTPPIPTAWCSTRVNTTSSISTTRSSANGATCIGAMP